MIFKISFTPNTAQNQNWNAEEIFIFLNDTDSVQTIHLLIFAQDGLGISNYLLDTSQNLNSCVVFIVYVKTAFQTHYSSQACLFCDMLII